MYLLYKTETRHALRVAKRTRLRNAQHCHFIATTALLTNNGHVHVKRYVGCLPPLAMVHKFADGQPSCVEDACVTIHTQLRRKRKGLSTKRLRWSLRHGLFLKSPFLKLKLWT